MGVRKDPLGPLTQATLRRVDDTTFWGPTQPPEIKPMDTDRAHTVRIADRIDNLAFAFLGDAALGWIILLRNDLRLTPNDLVPGRKIFIPTRQTLAARGVIQ